MKTVRYVLRLTLTLLMITAVVAAALGGVNSITAPKIAQIQAEKIQAAVSQVLPGGGFDQRIRFQPEGKRAVRTVNIAAFGIGLIQTNNAKQPEGYAFIFEKHDKTSLN